MRSGLANGSETQFVVLEDPLLRWTSVAWGQSDKGCVVAAASIDRGTVDEVIAAVHRAAGRDALELTDLTEAPRAMQRLVARLQAYASGEDAGDFRDVEVDLASRTPFQRRVLLECQRIAPGTTVSYGELAERCGARRAARAVGSVMSSNRVPLIIPCHRVVRADGSLKGYSSPSGWTMKKRLLRLEREAAERAAQREHQRPAELDGQPSTPIAETLA